MGSTSVGTNSAGVALGDHIKVGNSCVSVGSWSNTDHCYMGIALGYQSNTSNEPEKIHTATAYSFCAGMGSRIKGGLLYRHRQGDLCGRRLPDNPPAPGSGFRGITLAYNAITKEEVVEI